ncbi:MAG: IS1380 family transposase [Burkholderiales bacterium]
MKQGLLPYGVEVVEEAGAVTARGGLALAVEAMRALGVSQAIKHNVGIRRRARGSNEVAMIEALIMLLAAGGECVDDMAVLRADQGLCRLLDRALPSPDAVRRFLYEFHDEELIERARQERAPGQVAYIPGENAGLRGLAQVNVQLLARVAAQGKSRKATLDHDATIQESHKRQSLAHYKGGRGYQPSVIYWAEQDLVVADEYRDGNVPAGMENLRLIERGFASLPATVTEYAFRSDSACYDQQVLKWLANPKRSGGPQGPIEFTISADMTEELRGKCAAMGERRWSLVEDRVEESVHWTDIEFTPGDWPKDAQPLRYVAVRIRKKQGYLFAAGYDTKYLAVVSNRWELSGEKLLRWHWAKAGTIEHVHDVTKNELGAGVPPCGRFGANAAWYRLSLLAYNILSAMKSLVLPAALSAARPKRLRFALFTIAGRLTSHAGKLVLQIGEAAERLAGLVEARRRLATLAAASP